MANPLDGLAEKYEVVVSASGAFHYTGEYSVLFGQPTILMPIPLYTHIGMRLDDDYRKREIIDKPLPQPVRNYNDLKALKDYENTDENLPPELSESVLRELKRKIAVRINPPGKKPARGFEIKIVSEIPPRCGLSSSGALCSVIALATDLLTGRVDYQEAANWGPQNLASLQKNEKFRSTFRFAVDLETTIHGISSGCGPFSALVGAPDALPIIYSTKPPEKPPNISNISRNFRALRMSQLVESGKVDDFAKTLWERTPFILMFSGKPRPRDSGRIANAYGILDRFDEGIAELSGLVKANTSDQRLPRLLEEVRSRPKDLGSKKVLQVFGALFLSCLKNMLDGDSDDVRQMLDMTQDTLSFLYDSPNEINMIVQKFRAAEIACKITGAGGGGDLVLFSSAEKMKGNLERIDAELRSDPKLSELQFARHIVSYEVPQEQRHVKSIAAEPSKFKSSRLESKSLEREGLTKGQTANSNLEDSAGIAHDELNQLWEQSHLPNLSANAKGEYFEKFCCALFDQMVRVVRHDLDTENGEIDLVLDLSLSTSYMSEYGKNALVECKNWHGHVPLHEVGAFLTKVRLSRVKLGFMVSLNGFTKHAMRTLRNHASNESNPLVVPISGVHLEKLMRDRQSVEEFLEERVLDMKLRTLSSQF